MVDKKVLKLIHSILDAFEKEMHKIDMERLHDGGEVRRGNSTLNDSIRFLNAAKKQLLGY
jgi:hypothetical protein